MNVNFKENIFLNFIKIYSEQIDYLTIHVFIVKKAVITTNNIKRKIITILN